MSELRIRNWDRWQSYRKDRGQPPWIKVHRALMRDPNWVELTDAQRGQLVAMWLLAADRDGAIPSSPALIKKLCYLDSEPDLQLFMQKGFIGQGITYDANVASERRHHVTPETETETETETESKRALSRAGKQEPTTTPREELASVLDAERAEAVIEHRRRLRKQLTPHAARLLARKFSACPDPNEAADAMISNGWQGFEPQWLENRSGRGPGPPRKRSVVDAAVDWINEESDGQISQNGTCSDVELLPARGGQS